MAATGSARPRDDHRDRRRRHPRDRGRRQRRGRDRRRRGVAVSIGLAIALNNVSGAVRRIIRTRLTASDHRGRRLQIAAPRTASRCDTRPPAPTRLATTHHRRRARHAGAKSTSDQQATPTWHARPASTGGVTIPARSSVSPLNGRRGHDAGGARTAWEIVTDGGPTYVVTESAASCTCRRSTIDAVASRHRSRSHLRTAGSPSAAPAPPLQQVATKRTRTSRQHRHHTGPVSIRPRQLGITATMAAVSASIAGGSQASGSASIGVSISQNQIGTSGTPAQVQAATSSARTWSRTTACR